MASSLTSSSTALYQTQAQAPNPLDDFQSFNNLFTLAGCTKPQINGNRIQKTDIQNIICRSQSIGPDGGVQTDFGRFDYFIDDVTIVTIPRNSDKTGNSFATKISFKVFEPYSMGLFMLSLRTAGESSGYSNFKESPYIFMIEWIGYIDNAPGVATDNLTRIIPIKIIDVKFSVGTTGSTYEVEAIPYNEFGFREQSVRNVSDVQLSGATVKDILSYGPGSLLNQLQGRYSREKATKHIEDLDEIEIQFPNDYTDDDGSKNIIGDSEVYVDYNNGGTQPFPDPIASKLWFEGKQIYRTSQFKLEKDRNWHFTQEISIPDIINEVVIRSKYITNQVVGSKFKTDDNGMVNWYRIDARVHDDQEVKQLGRQKRTIIYRVIPYKVHIHRFLPPGEKPEVGFDNLRNTVTRVYNYIYTGQNTEILKLDLHFDMAFFTPISADITNRVGQSNPGGKGITAGGQEPNFVFGNADVTGGTNPTPPTTPALTTPSSKIGTTVTPSFTEISKEWNPVAVEAAQRQYFYKGPGGSGTDDAPTSQGRTMFKLLTNPGDMINLNMEIMGDPYYIPTSGMGSQWIDRGQGNSLSDGSMNYQDSEVMIIVNFRTPTDFDPNTGLYNFDTDIEMWSGLYQVIQVESKFNKNMFTQVIEGIRLRAQLGTNAQTIFVYENSNNSGTPSTSSGPTTPASGSTPTTPSSSTPTTPTG